MNRWKRAPHGEPADPSRWGPGVSGHRAQEAFSVGEAAGGAILRSDQDTDQKVPYYGKDQRQRKMLMREKHAL